MQRSFWIESFINFFLVMKRSKLYHLFYNLPLNPPHSLWLASEFLNIPHHPASPLLTLPPPSSPICSSASPALCLYRGWWGISILAWSICSDVVQREGPALIYYTCQLNFWRYILIHKGWVLYAGCVSASLILISWCISDHAECLSDFFLHDERLTVDGGLLYTAEVMRKIH